jgi:hypothetical protein
MTTWTTEDDNANDIVVGDTVQTVEGEISAADVSELAQDEGVSKFKVEDEDGNELDRDDFPVNHTVSVREYNENA